MMTLREVLRNEEECVCFSLNGPNSKIVLVKIDTTEQKVATEQNVLNEIKHITSIEVIRMFERIHLLAHKFNFKHFLM